MVMTNADVSQFTHVYQKTSINTIILGIYVLCQYYGE